MGWKEDLNYGLSAFGLKIPDAMPIDEMAPHLLASPMRNTAAIIGVSSAAFLAAERGHNPKVNDIYDAMIYCSTCLSVGYADIFPKTPVGKLIGTILMTAGPALAARALDGKPGAPNPAATHAVQQDILQTLKEILAKVEEKKVEAT